jgi:PAS domain S-box-containing protein
MLAAAPQEETAPAAHAPEVARERCDFLYRRVRAGAAATAVLSLLLSAFLWRSRPTELIVFWQLVMLGLAAAFWGLAVAYGRSSGAREDPPLWIRRAGFAAAALGAGWGFAAAVFFPGGQDEQVFIAFVVALVSAGGLPLFSTVWWIYAVYAAAVMLPFNAVLFAYGTEFFRMLGAALPLLFLANIATAWQLGRVFSSAFGLRGAYRRLSGDNAEIQAQLGEQLDSLLDAHREVQAYGRKLSLFSERAPIAVFEVDPRGTILDMNPAAENLFGWAAPEMVGRNIITMLLGVEDRAGTEAWWGQFVAESKPATRVVENCVRRDGLALACEWTMTPLVTEEGAVSTIVLQGRDITQQRAAERVRSEFTSTLSHELRTPLTSILGSLSLLRSGALGDVPKEQDEIVEIAERNGQRLLDLINEVLDIEKIESGRLSLEPEPIALADLLSESLRLNQGFADRFQVRLALEGAVPPVTVRADRKRLMQVMTNLLSNAAKFSPPGGSVDVSAVLREGMVRVGVGDRGPGIPAAFRNRIFGRFAQADSADSRIKGGTGLGLAISKRLVEMMQGRVGFEDREGGGTLFFFELPVLHAADEAATQAVRVLLTEEDAVAAEYLAMVLEKAGYRVDVVADAASSRTLLGRWKYAAWLLPRRLRDAEDALALIDEMRAAPRGQLADTRIIMLASLRSDQAGVPEPQRHGIVDWLLKNDSRSRIVEAVGQALGRQAAATPGG